MIIHRLPFVYKALSFLPLALPLFFLPQPLSASIKICQQSPAFGTCLYCVTLFKYSVDRGCISEDRTEDGQNKRSHGRKPRRKSRSTTTRWRLPSSFYHIITHVPTPNFLLYRSNSTESAGRTRETITYMVFASLLPIRSRRQI